MKKIRKALIGCAILLNSAYSYGLGNNTASFTFTGSQTGFTTGTVYTLSTAGNQLAWCSLAPVSSGSGSGYTPQCATNFGNTDSSGYTSVLYLGSASNPFTPFVAGDGSGNLYSVTPNWYSPNGGVTPYTVTGLNQQALGFQCEGSVANLAVDPSGNYLYVGCVNDNADLIFDVGDVATQFSSGYALYVLPIQSNSSAPGFTLGPAQSPPSSGYLFDHGWEGMFVWSGVSPIMRVYQAGFKGLSNTAYSSSGAVLISGLVSSISNNTNKGGPGPVPTNSGLICSNGDCQTAYNVTLENKSSFSVITAAEIGIDYSGSASNSPSNYHTALYWNQVEGQMTKQGGFDVPSIPWSSTSNTIYSCDTSANPIGTSAAGSCGSYSRALQWAPSPITAPGNGLNVDISNLMFTDAPSPSTGIVTSFAAGLLTVGTWTNGYVSYYSPATVNGAMGAFLGSLNSNSAQVAQVGNVNSLAADSLGNLMFQTNAQGLYVFNQYDYGPANTNLADGTDITLIPTSIDNSTNSVSSNSLVKDSEIAFYTVGTIETAGKLVAASAPAPHAKSSPIAVTTTPGFSLENVFGSKPYIANFLYTQDQLRAMGVKQGQFIKGIRLRNAKGYGASPAKSISFSKFNITLSNNSPVSDTDELSANLESNYGGNRLTVRKGGLHILKERFPAAGIHPDNIGKGKFGPVIKFNTPYHYKGGNLLVELDSSGSKAGMAFPVDAFGTAVGHGVYALPSDPSNKTRVIPAIPVVDFIK